MRYLLCKSEEDGLNHRIEYIFDIFKLYAIKTGETNKFIVLETFPFKTSTSYPKVLFIIGHSEDVNKYLEKNIADMTENIILTITCFPNKLKRFLKYNKQIYSSKNKNGITEKYKGDNWGFKFDISYSEIDLYNNRKLNLMDNIKKSMVKIKKLY